MRIIALPVVRTLTKTFRQVGITYCEVVVGSVILPAVKYLIEAVLLPITVFIILAFVWFLLRKFMFKNVYRNNQVKRDEDLNKVETVIKSLYEYYCNNPDLLPVDLKEIADRDGVNEAVKDYIAGMTDRFALSTYTDIFVPKGWK